MNQQMKKHQCKPAESRDTAEAGCGSGCQQKERHGPFALKMEFWRKEKWSPSQIERGEREKGKGYIFIKLKCICSLCAVATQRERSVE